MSPQSGSSSFESNSPSSRNKALILSVDDEPNILYTRELVLESAGYAVLSAPGGREALRLFDAHPIALVLLDYYMPDLNGGMVAAEMKRRNPGVPIIMISASIGVPKSDSRFVDSFIAKGEVPQTLLATIRRQLAISSSAGKSAT